MTQEIKTPIKERVMNSESCCSSNSCSVSSAPITRTDPKVGRNEPCPCGNGRKFKKCCGQHL